MNALEKMKTWIATYPDFDILGQFHVDYVDRVPANGGIFPAGLVELSRKSDIMGNVTMNNQYNFSIYCCFERAPMDEIGAVVNADWIMSFQEWVQEQSSSGKAPVFGDAPTDERISAQNGVLYAADEEGTATYMVQLSVQFTKVYEVENQWLI